MSGMVGWDGIHPTGERPAGIHPLALIGGPPESRTWKVGDPYQDPEIHPTALINSFVTVDAGLPEGPATAVGARTFVQSKAHIGHNAVVGDDCEICVGVTLCGYVRVGNGVQIAGNSWVRNRVTIGDGARIGGGSVVTKDVPAYELWVGNPARLLRVLPGHPDYEEPAPDLDPTNGCRWSEWEFTHASVEPHALHDREEVWEHMRPWHRRAA